VSLSPGSDGERRVRADVLAATVQAIFGRAGMPGTEAALLAETLVVADLRGVHSHGVLRVPEYVQKLAIAGTGSRSTR
jgi:L-2-hydroxycarboxylate dehydrogenase (NAD+)